MDEPTPREVGLWQALEERDDDRVFACIDDGAEINGKGGPYGSTPLGWAAMAGRAELVERLLKHGADPSVAAEKGSYPLHMACWNGDHGEVVEHLLAAGARAGERDGRGRTALQVARNADGLERGSAAEAVYELDAWRRRWGKPAAGRARVIALLEAADAAAEAEAAAEGEAAEAAMDDAVAETM